MSVFSTNQARQFYVVNAYKTAVSGITATGNAAVVASDTKAPYVVVKSAVDILRSDLLTNIESIKVTDGGALAKKLKSVKVELTANGGTPLAGQDYVLNIEFSLFAGISDEEKYFKYGFVHATSGMTKTEFFKELATSLVKNFSREISKLVEFKVVNGSGTASAVLTTANLSTVLATYTGAAAATQIESILINEASQATEWRLGVKPLTSVYYTVTTGTITVSNDEVNWGTVSNSTSGSVNNGYDIADLEYFCAGEKGDIYRQVGWPNNLETKYLITDPTASYAVLDVHYSYVGANEGAQKSEKDITIVALESNITALNGIANALALAAGMSSYTSISSAGVASQTAVTA